MVKKLQKISNGYFLNFLAKFYRNLKPAMIKNIHRLIQNGKLPKKESWRLLHHQSRLHAYFAR
jgi:hypothetical protein